MRHNQWIQALGLIAAAGATVAWGQRGGGAGMAGGRGMGTGSTPTAASSHGNMGSKSDSSSAGMAASKTNPRSTAAGGSIADRITVNSGLDSKVQTLLPAGVALKDATAGFKNMGQFIAALHVSRNLNIPFDQLRKEIVDGKSLGRAIKDLRPSTSKSEIKSQVKSAEAQAGVDLKVSEKKKS